MSKLPKTRALLNSQFVQKTRAVSSFVSRETLQLGSTIMVLAALVYKSAQDRAEIERLNGGNALENAPVIRSKFSDLRASRRRERDSRYPVQW